MTFPQSIFSSIFPTLSFRPAKVNFNMHTSRFDKIKHQSSTRFEGIDAFLQIYWFSVWIKKSYLIGNANYFLLLVTVTGYGYAVILFSTTRFILICCIFNLLVFKMVKLTFDLNERNCTRSFPPVYIGSNGYIYRETKQLSQSKTRCIVLHQRDNNLIFWLLSKRLRYIYRNEDVSNPRFLSCINTTATSLAE